MKLTKLKILFPFAALVTLFTACQKEVDFQDLNNPGSGGPGAVIQILY